MAWHFRKRDPHRTQERKPRLVEEVWAARLAVSLLTTRLAGEREALASWLRRLELQTAARGQPADASQLPVLRHQCAACHTRVLDLEQRLTEAHRHLRTLLADQAPSDGSRSG